MPACAFVGLQPLPMRTLTHYGMLLATGAAGSGGCNQFCDARFAACVAATFTMSVRGDDPT
jgi:hypothetical protein